MKNSATKNNTADRYIIEVYKKCREEEDRIYNLFEERTGLKMKKSYGNRLINASDLFSETGNEDLKFNYVGYGKVSIMGLAIDFPDKSELYFKNDNLKSNFNSMIKAIDQIHYDRCETIKYIESQHGKPKTQHAILAYIAGR